jgi:DNA-binding LacI/PurR family transcriptional regulator
VPLSSVDQDARRLGETAAQLALNIVKKREPMAPKTILLPAALVVALRLSVNCSQIALDLMGFGMAQ